MTDVVDSRFDSYRGRVFGIAYRMLGSRAEAEDLVQDVYLRWHHADRGSIRNVEAWLVTTASRLAIDRLRSLKTERDAYVGPWLPEPLTHDAPPPPDQHLDLAADLSVAFLVLLERLAPDERAAFLLHEAFDIDYREIAAALGKSEDACRQIVHRARARVRSERKRFEATEAARAHLVAQFTEAVHAGDQQRLLGLFAPDATWTADGGGRTAAARRPLEGADTIVRLLLGLRERGLAEAVLEPIEVNGETGLRARSGDRVIAVMSFLTDGTHIHGVYVTVNPDKLGGGAPLPGARG